MNFIDMVLKAGFKIRDLSVLPTHEGHITPELMRLVELARADERAKCVAKCMEIYKDQNPVSDYAQGKGDGALDCADAIEDME